MNTPHDEALTAPAARIADGETVDWKHEADISPGLEPRLEGLARVERIAEAWRGLGVTPEADDAMLPEERVLFFWGELEARERLGAGSFGEVFRAWDPKLQREVALKLRRDAGEDDSSRAELAEARQLARVRHPHVLQIYGVDVQDGRAGLWTELVHGRTLEHELQSRGRMSADEAALIGLDLCRALAAMHAVGLAHGDLKASNVMREDGGRIVLMDFGSVHEMAAGEHEGARGGARTGTPLSAAPEVLDGDPATALSDLYALGVLLYRLATGQYPVQAASLAELRDKLARNDRIALRNARPDLPTPFVTAVERAIEIEPGRRWPDAAALERALALTMELAAPVRVPEFETSRARTTQRSGSRSPMMVGVLILAVVALFYSRGAIFQRPAALPPAAAAPPVATEQSEPVVTPAQPQAEAGKQSVAPSEAAAVPMALATLWRSRGGERSALVDGSHVAPGDHLFLEFESAEPLHVYVLDEDEKGETFTLFPVAGAELSNPLPSSRRHRLPGERAGAPFDWVVTSAGGREHVLIVASRRRIAALEQLVAATASADPSRPVAYAPVGDETFATLRGIGGMAAAAPATVGRETKLEALARSLRDSRDGAFWVRQLSLESR